MVVLLVEEAEVAQGDEAAVGEAEEEEEASSLPRRSSAEDWICAD